MLFPSNNDQPFGEQYYSMLGDEDINPPKHHMAATSPDFFALSPLSTDQSCRNHHELLHHEEELNPFSPTTNGTPDVDRSRGGYSPSKHSNIDDDRYNPNNTAGGQDQELLVEKGGPRKVGSSSGGVQKRTRVVKKDRHSKIVTAHGPRDRRMRLSLEVARKFFDLQDMLGYDKASKTVEWLMTKSRSAIKILARDAKAASSTSECEVTSWVVEDNADDNTIAASSPHQGNLKKQAATRPKKKKKAAARVVSVRKPATQAREWRAMARARARERTWEKLCSRKNMEWSSSPVEESGSREVGPLEEPSSLSLPAADAMADNSCPPQIFAVSSSHGLNTFPSSFLQSHEMIEYYIQQNWELAGDASASLLHVPTAIGPHGGEGTYMSFVRPLPGFSPPS